MQALHFVTQTKLHFIIGNSKGRQERIAYNHRQRAELERQFNISTRPNACVREEIAQRLGVSETRVQVWFKNRRAKEKRMKQQAQQEVGL